MRRVLMGLMLAMAAVTMVEAQPLATPLHEFRWTMSDTNLPSLGYEVTLDGQPHAPVLGAACDAAGACRGDLPVSLTPGVHTARVRAVRVVEGVRLVGPDSNEAAFTYVSAPAAPQGFTVAPPPGAVAVNGTVSRPPYGFAGLEVAPVTLDGGGGQLLIAATRLSVPGYTVQQGDRMGLVMVPAR